MAINLAAVVDERSLRAQVWTDSMPDGMSDSSDTIRLTVLISVQTSSYDLVSLSRSGSPITYIYTFINTSIYPTGLLPISPDTIDGGVSFSLLAGTTLTVTGTTVGSGAGNWVTS